MTRTESDPVDRLLLDCLERWEAEGDAVIEALCAEHPQLAGPLRERIDVLRRAGLFGEPAAQPGELDRIGDFRLVDKLGAGGMGVVYLAEQESLQRHVALKLIRPELAYFEATQSRFQREVEVIASLQHPGIVPIYTVGAERGIPFFAMQLIDGCSLTDLCDELRGGPIDDIDGAAVAAAVRRRAAPIRKALGHEDRVDGADPFRGSWVEITLRLVRQAAEALDYAHSRGIVHRDVKPSNLAITADGRVQVLDFGLAASTRTAKLTRTGSQQGSVPYMSPEQVRGEPLDQRTDVYSLGVTLYELLTLQMAFEHPSSEATMQRILVGEVRPPREYNRGVARDVETVCLTAMDRDPHRRYQTAGALARDLGNLLTHHPIEARRLGVGVRLVRWAQRHPRLSAAALAGMALTSVGGVVFSQRERAHGVALAAERDVARDHARDLRQLAGEFLFDFHGAIEALPGATAARRLVIERAQRLLDKLIALRSEDPSVSRDLGLAHLRLGHLLGISGKGSLGDATAAEHHLAAARDILASLPDTDDAVLRDARRQLVFAQGRLDLQQGELDAAEAQLGAAVELARAIAADRGTVDAQLDAAEAERALARVTYLRGDDAVALAERQRLVRVCEAIADTAGAHDRAERNVVLALRDAAESLLHAGQQAESLQHYQRAAERAEQLVVRAPAHVHHRQLWVQVEAGAAELLARSGRAAAARAPIEHALAVQEELLASDPLNIDFGVHMMSVAMIGVLVFNQDGDDQAALQLARRASALGEQLTEGGRTPEVRRHLGWMREQSAALLAKSGDLAAATTELDRGIAVMEGLFREQPDSVPVVATLANAHRRAGDLHTQTGDLDAALEATDRDVELCRAWLERAPSKGARTSLAFAHAERGDVLVARGDADAALAAYREAVGVLVELADRYPEDYQIATNLMFRRLRCAALEAERDQPAAARREAMAVVAHTDAWGEHSEINRTMLAYRVQALGVALDSSQALQDSATTRSTFREWRAAWEQYAAAGGGSPAELASATESMLAVEFEDLRDASTTVRLAELALQRNGGDAAPLLRTLARAREASGDAAGAIDALQRAVAVVDDPTERRTIEAELARLRSR